MSYFNKSSRSDDDYDDDYEDDEETEDDEEKSPPPRSTNFFNRDKPADKPASPAPAKKDDAPRGMFGGLTAGRKPDDKPNDKDGGKDKKDAGNAGARPGLPGNVGSIFNRGGKPDDKDQSKDAKKNDPAGKEPGRPGGLFGGFGRKPEDDKDKGKEPPKPGSLSSPFGGGSSKPPTSTSAFGSKPGGGTSSGSSGSSPFGGNKPAGGAPGSGGSSPFGGNKPGGGSPGSSSSSSGSSGSSSFGSKPSGSSGPASGSGGSGGSGGGSSGNKPFGSSGSSGSSGSTPGTSGGGSAGSKLGGSSPFGGNKPADPKPASSGGLFGGAKAPDPRPGASTTPKPTAKDAKGDAPKIPNPLSGALGGIRNSVGTSVGNVRARLPFGNKPAETDKGAKPATPKAPASGAGFAGGATARPGEKISSTPGKKVPIGRGEKQARPLDKKPKPVVVKRAFSQDHQLDLLGIGLVVLGGIIFFGLLSPNDGSITGAVVKLLGQLFGYGRIIWPLPCVLIGGWLIVRHFGDEPPVVEYHRLIGWLVMFLALVTTLQWFELLQKPVPTLTALAKVSAVLAGKLQGGGWLGDKFYMLLVSTIGDYGTPVLLVGWWIIAIMLAFSITLAEITSYAKSITHFFGRARNGYMERKAQAAAAAALAAEAAQSQPVAVEAPANAPALASGGRRIGPLKLPATTQAPPPATATPVPVATAAPIAIGAAPLVTAKTEAVPATAAPAEKPSPVRGLFSRGSSTSAAGTAVAEAPPVAASTSRPNLFGGRSNSTPPSTGSLEPSKNPLTPGTVAATSSTASSNTAKAAAATPDNKDAPSSASKPAPFKLFGSRESAKSNESASAKAVGDPNAAAPAAKSPVSGLFSRSAPAKPADGDTSAAKPTPFKLFGQRSAPAKPDEPASKADDTKVAAPATPKSPTSGLFGSRIGASSGLNTPKTDAKPDGDNKNDKAEDKANPDTEKPAPAAPKSPAAGLFGSRPAANTAKIVDDTKTEDKTTSTPARPVVPGLFGARPPTSQSASPIGSAKADEQPSAKTDTVPDDEELPPATPKSPNLFASRPPLSTPPKPPMPSTKTADLPTEDDETEDEQLPPATPKSPTSGLFSSRPTSGFSSVTARPVEKIDDKPKADDATAEKLPPAAPKSSALGSFDSRPASGAAPAPTPTTKLDDEANLEDSEEADAAKLAPAKPKSATSGMFSARPLLSTPPTAKPIEKTDDKPKVDEADDIDDSDAEDVEKLPPAMPKSPVSGMFGSRLPSSTPLVKNPPPAKPKEDDGEEAEEDIKPSVSPLVVSPSGSTAVKPDLKSAAAELDDIDDSADVDDADADSADADDDDASDDEPKYIPLDDEAQPLPVRPAANRPLTPSLSAPRPPQPVTPRPFSGTGTPSTVRPSITPAPVSPATTAPPTRSAPIIRQPAAFNAPKPAESEKSAPPLDGIIVRSKGGAGWELPNYTELLEKGSQQRVDNGYLMQQARIIEDTLQSFGAPGKVVEINSGPVITQFGVEPDYLVSRQGKKTRIKVSSIAKLDADLALALAARSIRIEAPVPGKGYVGIEVPNSKTALVSLRDIMDSDVFHNVKSKLRIGLGQSVDGAPIAADLTVMPHLLIAGTTGSGKSVCVNAIIASLLLENTPDDLKFIMVDPKRVELTGYNGIPHLVAPVVVDLERIVGVLKWVTREMDERYKKFSQMGARNIVDFNTRLATGAAKLPYLVVVIDELADLMMLAPDETEKVLTRLAQMARATGIHLIVSTQRPSVDVVTGLIKANFPARISFAVASSVDSRVILDQPGAEKLLGRGDMLYQSPDAAAPVRMQGVYVSDGEINKITRYWKTAQLPARTESEAAPAPAKNVFETPEPVQSRSEKFGGVSSNASTPKLFPPEPPTSKPSIAPIDEDDGEMYEEAVKLYKENNNKISVSLLQRRLRVGYMRAARLIELMKERGLITDKDTATEDGKTDK